MNFLFCFLLKKIKKLIYYSSFSCLKKSKLSGKSVKKRKKELKAREPEMKGERERFEYSWDPL